MNNNQQMIIASFSFFFIGVLVSDIISTFLSHQAEVYHECAHYDNKDGSFKWNVEKP